MAEHIGKPLSLLKTLITRKGMENVTPWHHAQHEVPNKKVPRGHLRKQSL
jgi:hypothetical protein